MESELQTRLKRLDSLITNGYRPRKHRKLGHNIEFIYEDLRQPQNNQRGLYSANANFIAANREKTRDLGSFRTRKSGIDGRIQAAIKNYRPPKPKVTPPSSGLSSSGTDAPHSSSDEFKSKKSVRFDLCDQSQAKSDAPKFSFGSAPVPPVDSKSQSSAQENSVVGNDTKRVNEAPKFTFGQSAATIDPSKGDTPKFSFGAANAAGPSEPVKFGFNADVKAESKDNKAVTEPKPFSDEKKDSSIPSFGGSSNVLAASPKPFTFNAALQPSSDTKTPPSFKSQSTTADNKKSTITGENDNGTTGFKFGASSGISSSSTGGFNFHASSGAPGGGGSTSSSTPFTFGLSIPGPALASSTPLKSNEPSGKRQFNEKPSLNFGGRNSDTGPFNFGGGTAAAAAAASPVFGANASTFGANSMAAAPQVANPMATNPLAMGSTGANNPFAAGTTSGRKMAPLRRRIPKTT